MRISIELSDCLALDSETTDCANSVSNYEIERAALTIAHAMVNPCEYEFCKRLKSYPNNPMERLSGMGCRTLRRIEQVVSAQAGRFAYRRTRETAEILPPG